MLKKMKILFVISNTNIGGPQKSLLALLDNIDYNAYDIDVCVLKPGGRLKEFYNDNVNFVEISEIVTASTLPNDNFLKYLAIFLKNRKWSMFFDAIVAVSKHLIFKKNMNQERQKFWKKHKNKLPKSKEKYDLAFGILGLSTYLVVDLVISKKKYHWIRSDTRILKRDEDIDAEYFKELDGCLSVSLDCAHIFEEMYPFMKNKIDVFYNHIPVSFYRSLNYDKSLMDNIEDGVIKIITIARLDLLKGIELAIDACKELIDNGHKIKWYVLGGGKRKNEILKLIKDKNIEKSFILLGFQLNTLSFIRDADIFVHPSRTEGKSNAVDEAKYVGKPIVITNYDTATEQIQNNINGLISDMTGKSIASNVERIINDKELKNRLILNTVNSEDALHNTTNFFSELNRERKNNYDVH